MTETEALARLEHMLAYDSDPALTADDVEALLALSAVTDSNGLAPSDPSWTPTWDLNRGAAEGWRWKAAKAASRFDFQADGASYNRSKVMEQCERMAEQYRRRITNNILLQGTLASEA